MRIDAQRWSGSDGVHLPVCLPQGRGFRLAHAKDGACVFLDERGLCRIHAKFGEEAKPLACRIFPYVFHPGGKNILVSLRFSCPSVVANRGVALARQTKELERLARLVVPTGTESIAAPRINEEVQPTWPDFFRFNSTLAAILREENCPVQNRVLRALKWIELIEKAGSAVLSGPSLDEVLEALSKSAQAQIPRDLKFVPEPGGASRAPFRLLLLQYARRDTGSHLQRIWRYRWKLFQAALRFTSGSGEIPPLQEGFRSVPFAALEAAFDGIPPGGQELFTRYFRVKIEGLHYCGPAYYQIPLMEGFRHLALLFAATLWLARWLAVGAGRSHLTLEDIARALAVADHHHGYSPAFGSANFRRRARMLAKTEDISRFVAWYSR